MDEPWVAYPCPAHRFVWHVEREGTEHTVPKWRTAYFSQESAESEARRLNTDQEEGTHVD